MQTVVLRNKQERKMKRKHTRERVTPRWKQLVRKKRHTKLEIWTRSNSDKTCGGTWLGDYTCRYVSKGIGGMTMMGKK
jgi:hypothetical protein